MTFTALHRALGTVPGPLTDELLDEAVKNGVVETDNLDWKSMLPPSKGLPQTDFPKDVAAMANSGGGLIVFGVREQQKVATERVDVGELTETYERSLRSAAVTAISPPVFGLLIHRLGAEGQRAVIVEVPASVDGPHLIYKNDYFGAPVRNDADTVWMKERQIEAMYRARFEERRHATEALDNLYEEALQGRDTSKRAWLIAVAHPRLPQLRSRLSRAQASEVFTDAERLGLFYAGRGGIHPLDSVWRNDPRPGLRRWVAVNAATDSNKICQEAWASIHDDGSVTLSAAVGGLPDSRGNRNLDGWDVESSTIECCIADLMALIHSTATYTANSEYDVRIGVICNGSEPLRILTRDNLGMIYDGLSTPLHRYTPVETTISARKSDSEYLQYVYELARDCVNQGGISNLRMITPQADG